MGGVSLMSRSLDVVIVLAIGFLISVMVGCIAAFLAWKGGAHPTSAVLRGGVAFGGSMCLWLAGLNLFVK